MSTFSIEHKITNYTPATDNVLQLDIDGYVEFDRFSRVWSKMRDNLIREAHIELGEPLIKPSKTQGHFHITIPCSSLPATERILLQACLGSDSTRELLNWCRVRQEIADPIILAIPTQIDQKG